MTSILSLPNELITRIGDYLPDKDLAHLAQGTVHLSKILSRSLLERAMEEQPPPVVKIHALLWAIHHGHTSLVKTILSQPNFSRYVGGIYDALDFAAELGHSEMIPHLIAAGYKVKGHWPKSPLHTAALNGHASVVTQLLDHGARIHRKDGQDRTPLICAIEAPSIIGRKISRKGHNENDHLQLIQKIEAQVIATIQVLLHRGAHSELLDGGHSGNTPLHHAVFNCLESALDLRVGSGIFRLLLHAGASLTARNTDQLTPLELAVTHPTACPTALTFFLDIGLSPNTKDSNGHCLLSNSIVCTKEAFSVMQVLLDRGAIADEINLRDFLRDSQRPDPILCDKIITLLLIHGASFGDSDSASECFSYAALNGMFEVMKAVLGTCAGIDINKIGRAHV